MRARPWTLLALSDQVRFMVRWKKDDWLVGPEGRLRKPWEITRGKRSWEYRLIWDARRWQIEMSIRFTPSELAFECPRLHEWHARLKFWWIATLAYAFLLWMLSTLAHRGETGCWSSGAIPKDSGVGVSRFRCTTCIWR